MPDIELALIPTSSPIAARADVVLEAILNIKTTLMRRALELGRLLKEARDNDYHLVWGFGRFGDWVELSSGLDMSARSAYDLIKMIEQSARLGISDAELEKVKKSKLIQIFSLTDGEMDDDSIRELVAAAETMKLEDVKEQVGIAKQQEWVNRNYKFDKTGYENVIKPTIERIKREHGSTMGDDGGEADISDSKALEICCADYAAGPEFEADAALDAEYEDVLEDTYEVIA